MFTGALLSILHAMWKAKRAPPMPIDEALLVHLRPPLTVGFLQDLAARSEGQLAWARNQYGELCAFGVAMGFDRDGRTGRIRFTPDFSPRAWVDSIRIGMPLDELRRRYPALERDLPDPDDEIRLRAEAGPDGTHCYAAMTASGHELDIRVRHGRVLSFAVAVPGWRAADKAAMARMLAGRKEAARKVAEHQARQRRFLGNLATTAAEDEAMLDHWATEAEDGRRRAASLRRAGPDRRHAIAAAWNWDDGLEPLFWIIRRPDCDKATALTILCMSEADYYLRYAGRPDEIPSSNLEGFWLSSEILDRWMRGFYTRSEIAFAAQDGELPEMLDRAGRVQPPPASMTTPLPGRSVRGTRRS